MRVEHDARIQYPRAAGTGWTRAAARVDHWPMEWRAVSASDFDAYLAAYPRPLTVEPPLERKANHREWSDPARGAWPDSVVAVSVKSRRATFFRVLSVA